MTTNSTPLSPELLDELAAEGYTLEVLPTSPTRWALKPLPVKPVLIGLGGLKESGKDTVADFWVEDFPQRKFVKIGMSDALHEMVMVLNPWINITAEDNKNMGDLSMVGLMRYAELTARVGYVKAKRVKEYREVLQRFGTEVGRQMIDEQLWVNKASERIENLMAAGHSVIVTAIRFPNELEMLKNMGGTPVWVERPDTDSTPIADTGWRLRQAPVEALRTKARATIKTSTEHASENSVSTNDFSLRVVNDSTLEHLQKQAARTLHVIDDPERL